MKKNNLILVALAAIVAIAGLSFYAMSRDNNANNMMVADSTNKMQQKTSMVDMNSSTYKEYAALKGEDYDRLFMSNMIAHHQGAIDMAELALTSAKHQEIKDLATAIVTAQTTEIKDMTRWQTQWGYPATSGEAMVDHSSMGMMAEMGRMTDSIKGLNGDTFDQFFIAAMIEHHQSAIDMAASGKTNAYHEEIITLSQNIVTAQSNEITQMKQWQKDWGYTN